MIRIIFGVMNWLVFAMFLSSLGLLDGKIAASAKSALAANSHGFMSLGKLNRSLVRDGNSLAQP
jgi:hypothetical protein